MVVCCRKLPKDLLFVRSELFGCLGSKNPCNLKELKLTCCEGGGRIYEIEGTLICWVFERLEPNWD